MGQPAYDPFVPGPFTVCNHSLEAHDAARGRLFPCDIWRPAETGAWPLVVFSHHSRGNRRAATFLTTHLASHGYAVAALDHSEVVAPELAGNAAEIIASRVPDVRFLLDCVFCGPMRDVAAADPARIGIVGHSFGGWTALALPETEPRLGAVVALAPGGASNPRPGILPVTLTFLWSRPPPTLYIVAEQDVCLPLAGMHELYARTLGQKQMVILRRADHMHFLDNAEEVHERVRAMTFPPPADWIPREMRPISELCTGEEAHRLIRGLSVAHLDASLKDNPDARRLLGAELARRLADNSIDAYAVLSGAGGPLGGS